MRRDQFMLDTQTGRLWRIVCLTQDVDDCGAHALEEVRYVAGDNPPTARAVAPVKKAKGLTPAEEAELVLLRIEQERRKRAAERSPDAFVEDPKPATEGWKSRAKPVVKPAPGANEAGQP